MGKKKREPAERNRTRQGGVPSAVEGRREFEKTELKLIVPAGEV